MCLPKCRLFKCLRVVAEGLFGLAHVVSAHSHQLETADSAVRGVHRLSEFFECVAQQPHFAISDTEIVVGLVVSFGERFADTLLEFGKDRSKTILCRSASANGTRGPGRRSARVLIERLTQFCRKIETEIVTAFDSLIFARGSLGDHFNWALERVHGFGQFGFVGLDRTVGC